MHDCTIFALARSMMTAEELNMVKNGPGIIKRTMKFEKTKNELEELVQILKCPVYIE